MVERRPPGPVHLGVRLSGRPWGGVVVSSTPPEFLSEEVRRALDELDDEQRRAVIRYLEGSRSGDDRLHARLERELDGEIIAVRDREGYSEAVVGRDEPNELGTYRDLYWVRLVPHPEEGTALLWRYVGPVRPEESG